MFKNTAGQKWVVFAFQGQGGAAPGDPVTGNAANITANLRIDGAAANAVDDTNPSELEDGLYVFDITQAETNGNCIAICPQSATADVRVIGVPGVVYTTTDISAVPGNVTNIQSRIPAALNNGTMPADVQRVNNIEIVGDGSGTPFNV